MYIYAGLLFPGDFIVPAHQMCITVLHVAHFAPETFCVVAADTFAPPPFPVDVIIPPHLMCVCLTFALNPLGELEEEMENPEMADLPEKQKHQLRHRELFLSRQLESLPATHIRYTAAHLPAIIPTYNVF